MENSKHYRTLSSRSEDLRKLSDIGFPYKHCYFKTCLPSRQDGFQDRNKVYKIKHHWRRGSQISFTKPNSKLCMRIRLATYSFGRVGHGFRELVRKKSQHCSEGAQGSGKQNEEGKFFFGINGEFMMT